MNIHYGGQLSFLAGVFTALFIFLLGNKSDFINGVNTSLEVYSELAFASCARIRDFSSIVSREHWVDDLDLLKIWTYEMSWRRFQH